jgi:YXWGXW repeat-containing protein
MRKIMLIFIFLMAPTFTLTTGCVFKTEKKEVVRPVATQPPPPPPRVEERSAPPYETSVWVPGHWNWDGHEYVWVPGYWQQ